MNELLAIEPQNLKALYLRGKALYQQGAILEAYQDFCLALEVDPSNQIIANYVSQLQS